MGDFRFREIFNAMSINPLQGLKEFFGTRVRHMWGAKNLLALRWGFVYNTT